MSLTMIHKSINYTMIKIQINIQDTEEPKDEKESILLEIKVIQIQ